MRLYANGHEKSTPNLQGDLVCFTRALIDAGAVSADEREQPLSELLRAPVRGHLQQREPAGAHLGLMPPRPSGHPGRPGTVPSLIHLKSNQKFVVEMKFDLEERPLVCSRQFATTGSATRLPPGRHACGLFVR